jgi:hypothetical protein
MRTATGPEPQALLSASPRWQFVQPGAQGNARLKLAESAKQRVFAADSGWSATKRSRMHPYLKLSGLRGWKRFQKRVAIVDATVLCVSVELDSIRFDRHRRKTLELGPFDIKRRVHSKDRAVGNLGA